MNNRGVLHKLMLVAILTAGFGLAIALPQLKKQADVRHARQALQTAQQLLTAEQAFYKQNGFYSADLAALVPGLPCQSVDGPNGTVLHCHHYEFALETAQTLRAGSKKYPKWFTVSLEDGTITCNHEDGSWVGERICAKMDL